MSKKLDVADLLAKNPEAKEIFEKNALLLKDAPPPKKSGYGLGLPYANPRVRTDERGAESRVQKVKRSA